MLRTGLAANQSVHLESTSSRRPASITRLAGRTSRPSPKIEQALDVGKKHIGRSYLGWALQAASLIDRSKSKGGRRRLTR